METPEPDAHIGLMYLQKRRCVRVSEAFEGDTAKKIKRQLWIYPGHQGRSAQQELQCVTAWLDVGVHIFIYLFQSNVSLWTILQEKYCKMQTQPRWSDLEWSIDKMRISEFNVKMILNVMSATRHKKVGTRAAGTSALVTGHWHDWALKGSLES